MKRREIELPVCEICGNVGAQPGTGNTGKRGVVRFSCVGGRENPHKRERMELRLFREVRR